uniref:Transcriptional regulator n=1 Tax=Shewanella decolorationis TaxID=256839 RepID=A0A5B8R3L4_9GAMM
MSEADYNIALKRIETLFHAVPNTPEGDELEALISFVNAYEDLNYPM